MISSYFPEKGLFISESGEEYDVELIDEQHMALLAALAKLRDGASMQGVYTQIVEDFNFVSKHYVTPNV
jgi:hypothetical protein